MRWAVRIAAIQLVLWLGFVGLVYTWMRQDPEKFAAKMAVMPMPAMLLFPFETLWTQARSGTIQVGDEAPDFELASADRKSKVRLAAYRGVKPVVLVFGSYT